MRHATGAVVAAGGFDRAAGDTYYIKGGLRERWHPLGHTVLYGEYEKFRRRQLGRLGQRSASTLTPQLWGLGVVQEIDAAAMSLWLSYRHIDADIDGVGCAAALSKPVPSVSTLAAAPTDFQYVKAGALINF